MSTLRSSDLPGVGKRYSMILDDMELVMIIHHTGERELFMFELPEDDEPCSSVTMSDEEARQLTGRCTPRS